MNEITLEWQEAGKIRKVVIGDRQVSKNPGTVRLGRDPVKADIVLTHPTVSGLHVEIFFNQNCQCFQVRNLRQSNPPLVDGKNLIQGEMVLSQGSTICLGQTEIKVVAVSLAGSSVPPTILMPPNSGNSGNQIYGLKCPKCDRISPFEQLDLGCPWCGTSLAAASSVLITPNTL
ncbi:FHA domain-containing protein [Phormidium sp. LEGE 05292]|uniref:FHA domain-containing protein n=1 Tax=[Phormidium] sp. LEGE 05292 TaxID=767427 RepID=UPI00187FAD6D|nr:FHA domain-containing protein [Phormidium sp. LEGE 05292]MBE9227289.1 FHA domain-containing protein [Phormidium sp. LEGE 05292]